MHSDCIIVATAHTQPAGSVRVAPLGFPWSKNFEHINRVENDRIPWGEVPFSPSKKRGIGSLLIAQFPEEGV